MPALPSLRPTDVALTNNVVVVGAANAAIALNDSDPSTVVAGDTTYVYDSGTSNGDLGVHITDMPADFSRIQSPLTVRAVTQAVGFTDDTDVLSVQIFDSTGNTAYTNAVTISQRTQGGTQDTTKAVRTASLTVNATGLAANKTAWDGARLRLIWTYTTSMSKDNGSIQVWAVEIDGDYTAVTTTTVTRTHSVDASLVKRRTLTHTTDTVRLKKTTRTHNVDSVRLKKTTRTHTINAALLKKLTRTHNVDASIATANIPPVASFTASPNPVSDTQTAITLTSTSTDSDGTIVSYLWELVSGPSGGSFNTPTASTAIFTPTSSSIVMSGGTETIVGAYKYHTFTTGGTLTVTQGGSVEYLVVAGGGGGGGSQTSVSGAGGGGAGGALFGSVNITNNQAITVGAGGAGGIAGTPATEGQNSSIGSLISATGGGGGSHQLNTQSNNNGGSGGGGWSGTGSSEGSGGTGIAGQGNAGGQGQSLVAGTRGGGGGGGASSVGDNADPTGAEPGVAGHGGTGIQWPAGSGNFYAGGGGGGTNSNDTTRGLGTHGGGNGGYYNGSSDIGNGTNAASNTGSGGGGGGRNGSGSIGGNGGSGIVIVRYLV